jgi:hypothetical protein
MTPGDGVTGHGMPQRSAAGPAPDLPGDNLQLNTVGAKSVIPDPDIELVASGVECLERVSMICCSPRQSIQRLHKRVGRARLAANKDPRDD